MAKVPDGRYAVEIDGTTKFYRVNTPSQGKWKGYTFVEVQASDDLYPVRDRHARMAIFDRIGNDPKAASALYGQRIGRCGVCGRTLTDEESRALGIGPICIQGF